jgi:hypothetical protein
MSLADNFKFLSSKKQMDSEPKIALKEHKRVVNEMLSAVVQMNLIVAEWSKDVVETAEKSNNREVIQFTKSSLLSLKKKLTGNLLKVTGNNDRV